MSETIIEDVKYLSPEWAIKFECTDLKPASAWPVYDAGEYGVCIYFTLPTGNGVQLVVKGDELFDMAKNYAKFITNTEKNLASFEPEPEPEPKPEPKSALPLGPGALSHPEYGDVDTCVDCVVDEVFAATDILFSSNDLNATMVAVLAHDLTCGVCCGDYLQQDAERYIERVTDQQQPEVEDLF